MAAAPAPADPVPPRKLTASRLFGALTRQPRFRDAMAIQQVVPYGAMVVLKAVCQAIVDSPELGFYRPPLRLQDAVEVAIASRIGRSGAEGQVASDLEALIDAGMVAEVDGAWTVPVDLPALLEGAAQPGTRSMARPIGRWTAEELQDLSARQRSAILNGHKGGRPRKRADGQREMAVHGVVAGNPDAPRAPRTETQGGPQLTTHAGLGYAENPSSHEFGFLGSRVLAAATLPEKIDSIGFEGEQQPGSEDAGGAHEEPTMGSGGNPRVETHAPETHGAETHGTETQGPAPAGAQAIEVARARAQLLALKIVGEARLGGMTGTPAADKVLEWLGFPGMTEDRIFELAMARARSNDAKRGQPGFKAIGSFDYFDAAMREAAGVPIKKPPTGQADDGAGMVTVEGFPFPAGVDLKGVERNALGALSGALRFARDGQVASLAGSVRRLEGLLKAPLAMAVLRREVPDLQVRLASAAAPTRAAG